MLSFAAVARPPALVIGCSSSIPPSSIHGTCEQNYQQLGQFNTKTFIAKGQKGARETVIS